MGPTDKRQRVVETRKGIPKSAPKKKARIQTEHGKPSSAASTKTRFVQPKSHLVTPKPAPLETRPKSGKPAVGNKGKGKAKAVDDQSSFLVIAGSYEKLLYGLEGTISIDPTSDSKLAVSLKPVFIFPAHLGCVKCVAASPGGKWLASGSEDEFVKVWDLRRRKEVGSLSQHSGSITSLHFPTSSHLLTTSADSTLCLFRNSDWALLKSLKGHSGRVNHVDVHPTGKVALSVGKDKTLRMWDLMRGRGASSLPLDTEAEVVRFAASGNHFAVLYPRKIEIYSLGMELLHRSEGPVRYNAIDFSVVPEEPTEDAKPTETEILCVGTEKGNVEVYRLVREGSEESGETSVRLEHLANLVGHTNRIKALSHVIRSVRKEPSGATQHVVLLSTVSSDGFINIYNLSSVTRPLDNTSAGGKPVEAKPVASYDTKGSRLVCVTMSEHKRRPAPIDIKREPLNGAHTSDVDVKEETDHVPVSKVEKGAFDVIPFVEDEDDDELDDDHQAEVEHEDEVEDEEEDEDDA